MASPRSELVEWALAQGDQTDPSTAVGSPLPERFRAYRQFRRLLAFDPPPRPASPPAAPVNGRYRDLELVGAGGYGEVYRATDDTLGRPVALKFLRGELMPGARDAFLREARILAGLRHPNIVTIHDADTDVASGRAFLALAWMAGGSLAGRLAGFRSRPDRAARLVERAARGVEHAHAAGVVHRDLKPANILLGEADEVCVADYGIAKLLGAGGLAGGEVAIAEATVGRGTPPYMAPEQFDPSVGPVAPWTDVWALGCILYELLLTEKAFPGGSREECAQFVLGRPPAPTRPLRGRERQLMRIALRCLEKRPADRFPSAAVLAEQLAAAREPSRRWFLLGGTAVTALTTTTAWIAGRGRPDPGRAFDAETAPLLAALERGEAVELIRPGTTVPSHLIRSGNGATRVEFTADGFEVWSPGLALADLLPRLPNFGYQVVAEVCHHSSELGPGTDAGVGIVFAAGVTDSPDATDHFFGTVRVNEHDHPTDADVRLGAFWYRDMKAASAGRERPVTKYYPSPECVARFAAGPGVPRPSRRMTLVYRSGRVTAQYQATPGHTLGPMTGEFLDEKFAQVDLVRPTVGTRLRGAFRPVVGVYVRGGRAVFRSIRVIPD